MEKHCSVISFVVAQILALTDQRNRPSISWLIGNALNPALGKTEMTVKGGYDLSTSKFKPDETDRSTVTSIPPKPSTIS